MYGGEEDGGGMTLEDCGCFGDTRRGFKAGFELGSW